MARTPGPPAGAWTEAERLAALGRYDVLDTAPEQEFDDIVAMAADVCDAPIALVSLLDEDRQFFKAKTGTDLTETPREVSFCTYAIQDEAPLIVPDATADSRFAQNPLVTGDTHLRFYAGMPLVTPEGYPLGTLCVIDTRPRTLDETQKHMLELLAKQAMTQLELRRTLAESEAARSEAEQARAQVQEAVERQKELVQEMAHRMKNTLTIVQAIVTQSLRQVDTLEDARGAIEARLAALGRAQNALIQTASGETPIREVISASLAPHASTGADGPFLIDGPQVLLGTRQALGLALGLHELATNATKYGSLTAPAGSVAITWSLTDEGFVFEWREMGGPPVNPPARAGFGSRLVERIVAAYFEGRGTLDFAPAGVVFRLEGKARTDRID